MNVAANPDYGPEWSASLRRGTEDELRGWVEAAIGWCDETDAIAFEHFRRNPSTERKPDRTFVTVADTSIERLLRERIEAAFPDHGIVGEEFGDARGGAATRWYLDPIDGTHNYMRGVPVFGTLLAVERDGELQASVISAPALGERWQAWRGGGAWSTSLRDGTTRRIHVSAIERLDEASVLFTSETEIGRSGRAPGLRKVLEGAWRERGFGDFWSYTLVADGAAEAMLEVGLKSWDAAAPWVLIEEAGGRVTDFDGRRRIDGPTILATNGHLHDAVRSALVGREETSG